jgi:hypothetical protein
VVTMPKESSIGLGIILSGIPFFLFFKKKKVA